MTTTADIALPTTLTPSSQTFSQRNRTAVFLGGSTAQRLIRPAPRWAVSMVWRNVDDLQRRQIIAFLAECEGPASTALIPYVAQAAAVPSSGVDWQELILQPITDDTYWGESDADFVSDFGRTRIISTSASVIGRKNTVLASTASQFYAFQAFGRPGNDTGQLSVGVFPSSQTDIVGLTTVNGRAIEVGSPTGASMDISAWANTTPAIGAYSFFDFVSAQRCGRVDGASQTGYSLNVKDVEASTLIRQGGEFFECNGQVFMLATDARSDASGDVTLNFTPQLRGSPVNHSYVLFDTPRLRMHLEGQVVQWSDTPHRLGTPLSSVSATFVEVLD